MMRETKGLTGDLRIKTIDIKKQRKPMKKFLTMGIVILLLVVSITILNIQVPKEKENEELSDELVRRVDAKVALYSHNTDAGGSYPGCSVPHARMFEYAGCDVHLIDTDDITNNVLITENFDVVTYTGGFASVYNIEHSDTEWQNIRDFVNAGGSYLGICAGAFFACDICKWGGASYDSKYELNLFDGTGAGPIDDLAPWPGYNLANITVTDADFPSFNGQTFQTMYYGGPYFYPNVGSTQVYDVVAEYDYPGGSGDAHGEPAMIKFEYGAGRVFLSGPHPENEENGGDLTNPRDWSYWDDFHSDDGSPMVDPDTEWDLMADVIAWMCPTKVVYEKKSQLSDFERSAPPNTPYRAAIMADLGVRTRALFPICKMLDYYGVTPLVWDEHCCEEITISRFDLVVFPDGDKSTYDGHFDSATMDTYFDAGGAGMGINAGCIWFDEEGYYSGTVDNLPPSGIGQELESITINDGATGSGQYDSLFIEDWDCDGCSMPISGIPGGDTLVATYDDEPTEAAMVKFEYGTNNAPIFLSGVSLQFEEADSSPRDGSYWDNEYNDPESEWDLMENILNWMGFVTIPEFTEILIPLTGMVFIAAIFSLKRRKD